MEESLTVGNDHAEMPASDPQLVDIDSTPQEVEHAIASTSTNNAEAPLVDTIETGVTSEPRAPEVL
jgi:hypothetical protein